ncbi:MAG: sigma-70 family RNA polymerase sigma factor [Acidobacteriota bacterium]
MLTDTPSHEPTSGGGPPSDGGRPSHRDLSAVLARWNHGDPAAVERLLPLVYDELRRLARGHLRRERADHTLQPTALVHEAYLRLADRLRADWRDRGHFYAVAAKIMRQILVDHARRHAAEKRGGQVEKVHLDDPETVLGAAGDDPRGAQALRMLALDDALERLRRVDPRKAEVIELRFFGGLTLDETADTLGVSTPTVVNEARKAKAWLFKEMRGGKGHG